MANRVLHRTCIICPRGCPLLIEISEGQVSVEGNECPKGEDHGIEEATTPRRIVTTTVRTTVPAVPRLPVRTAGTVPLADILTLMREIDSVVVGAPVRCGDTVATSLGRDGVSLVATDDLYEPGE